MMELQSQGFSKVRIPEGVDDWIENGIEVGH